MTKKITEAIMNRIDDATFVKEGTFGVWAMYTQDGTYFFRENEEDGKWALTPKGNLLSAGYIQIADQILDDLDSFDIDYMGPDSSIPWQFTFIDSFEPLAHEEIERVLDESFLQKKDWSLDLGLESDQDNRVLLGITDNKKTVIREWLAKCTKLQLTAACCIGNAYHSLNVAYQLAALIEHCSGDELSGKTGKLADLVASITDDVPFDVMQAFSVFERYYRVDFEENGSIT